MKKKNELASLLVLFVTIFALRVSVAGGNLETFDLTDAEPSPLAESIPGAIIAKVVDIKWDPRCIPVRYSMNQSQVLVPNPLGEDALSIDEAQQTIQGAMDVWNKIPTSYIHMEITSKIQSSQPPGSDFVNEQTFITPPGADFVAASPSTSLMVDTFFSNGDDLDGDGDADVSNAVDVCQDVDGDGDIEFPEGQYSAGTILDNDIMYNAELLRFTVKEKDVDSIANSVDLSAAAVHELGHSHGLSHTLNNQKSVADGTGATMFPFIQTTDPASELSARDLDSDDIAYSSFYYPEGTAVTGPAALQRGDIPFAARYGIISGEITQGQVALDRQPLAGASVFAKDLNRKVLVASAISGTTRLTLDPASGELALTTPEFDIVNGNYSLPVPKGQYQIGIEAIDGDPVDSGSVNITALVGDSYGQQSFTEEFYNGVKEGAFELSPGRFKTVRVKSGQHKAKIDLETNVDFSLGSFGTRDAEGFDFLPPGSYYAVAFSTNDIVQANTDLPGQLKISAGLFHTRVQQVSMTPIFTKAVLTTCEVTDEGSAIVNLKKPLRRDSIFVGQDDDFAPFYFSRPHRLASRVLKLVARRNVSHLCLVLQVPLRPAPGSNGIPPLIALDGGIDEAGEFANDVPLANLSFISVDGDEFFPVPFNFRFDLRLSVR